MRKCSMFDATRLRTHYDVRTMTVSDYMRREGEVVRCAVRNGRCWVRLYSGGGEEEGGG